MSDRVSRVLRGLAGAVSLLVLLALALLVGTVHPVRAPGVVAAEQTFSVASPEPGNFSWTLESGRAPIGGRKVSERALQSERAELMEVDVPDAVITGAVVQKDQVVAELGSQRSLRRLEEFLAEKDALEAERDLLVAGGRPEAITAAGRAVTVAEARRTEAQASYDRLVTLGSSGAISREDLRSAELALDTATREVELARSLAAAAHVPPRPEEIMAMDARLTAAEARITETIALLDQQQVKSPIAGLVEVGGDALVRVYDLDPVYIRAAVSERDRAAIVEGAPVLFRATGVGRFEGRVAEIAESVSITSDGQPVLYVTAEIPNPDLALRTGMSGSIEFRQEGIAGQFAARATDALGL